MSGERLETEMIHSSRVVFASMDQKILATSNLASYLLGWDNYLMRCNVCSKIFPGCSSNHQYSVSRTDSLTSTVIPAEYPRRKHIPYPQHPVCVRDTIRRTKIRSGVAVMWCVIVRRLGHWVISPVFAKLLYIIADVHVVDFVILWEVKVRKEGS